MTPVDVDESAQGPKTADNPMQLLVFAQTPPPHHGQSYMVQLMLNELGEMR